MKNSITVNFYKKTYTHCPACEAMEKTLTRWIEENEEVDVTVFTLSLEDNADKISTKFPDAKQAPIVEVERPGERTWVSGNNPDILVDLLNGDQDIWDEL